MLGKILDCFYNLYLEAGSLSQIQISPIVSFAIHLAVRIPRLCLQKLK